MMPENVESNVGIPTRTAQGGFTLHDLIMAMAAGWGLPVAVLTALGPASVWRFPAYLVGAVGGLLWAFYSRKLELLVISRVLGYRQGNPPEISFRLGETVYLGVLGFTVLTQYALYRACRLLIGMTLQGS
jgi:hypothetical protein